MQRTAPELTANARALRTNATDAERLLWRHLRPLRPRFTRQLVIGSDIADFACRSARVVIELDGGQHSERQAADQQRAARIQADGWRILRFWNDDVLSNIDGVLLAVIAEVGAQSSTHPRPLPSRKGRFRVLILRPEPGASATAGRARAAGLDPLVAPLFAVRPVAWEPPPEPVDAVMLTSANAPRHAGPALARYRDLPAYVVGEATAAAARAAGFGDVHVAGRDAASLVAAIPAGTRVLHLAGREHRTDLPAGGIRRIVYASDAIGALSRETLAALEAGAVALLHSPRAATLFRRLVADPAAVAIATLSRQVADAAGPGWRAVTIAATPDDDALIRAVCVRGDRV